MKRIKSRLVTGLSAVVIGVLLATGALAAAPSYAQGRIANKVRHELVTLPYYGVFDNLAYKVDGSVVTLFGQVVRPSTRSDAQARVARIAGVSKVVNRIEVLPLSSADNSIRQRTYRAIARTAGLNRYLMGANPSIHIVVGRGHVTLEGVVANDADRQLAFMAANGVSGVFSVKNNLRTDREIPG
jgi:hyperosmotically inducible protein